MKLCAVRERRRDRTHRAESTRGVSPRNAEVPAHDDHDAAVVAQNARRERRHAHRRRVRERRAAHRVVDVDRTNAHSVRSLEHDHGRGHERRHGHGHAAEDDEAPQVAPVHEHPRPAVFERRRRRQRDDARRRVVLCGVDAARCGAVVHVLDDVARALVESAARGDADVDEAGVTRRRHALHGVHVHDSRGDRFHRSERARHSPVRTERPAQGHDVAAFPIHARRRERFKHHARDVRERDVVVNRRQPVRVRWKLDERHGGGHRVRSNDCVADVHERRHQEVRAVNFDERPARGRADRRRDRRR